MNESDNLFDITDQVVVMTGATGALAGPAATYLLAQGARMVCFGRSPEKLARLQTQIAADADRALVASADVLDRNALQHVYEQTMEKFGRIDTLINAAGGNMPGATVPPDKSLFDIAWDDYRQVMDVNFHGTLLPTLVFGQALVEQQQGCIVNFSSLAADRALTRVAGYSNAKAAVENFTRWLAVELCGQVRRSTAGECHSARVLLVGAESALAVGIRRQPDTTGSGHLAWHTLSAVWPVAGIARSPPLPDQSCSFLCHRYRPLCGWGLFVFQWRVTCNG